MDTKEQLTKILSKNQQMKEEAMRTLKEQNMAGKDTQAPANIAAVGEKGASGQATTVAQNDGAKAFEEQNAANTDTQAPAQISGDDPKGAVSEPSSVAQDKGAVAFKEQDEKDAMKEQVPEKDDTMKEQVPEEDNLEMVVQVLEAVKAKMQELESRLAALESPTAEAAKEEPSEPVPPMTESALFRSAICEKVVGDKEKTLKESFNKEVKKIFG